MNPESLALFGGTPVRARPFIVEPMVDGEEERLVLEAIRARSFSRYIGSTAPDIETTLRMTSAAAATIGDYWHFLGGPHVRQFAAEFARAFDVPYAIPVNAATMGIAAALAASGVGPGDEVILPAISFSATASAVLLFNSIPVFVDVDPDTFCIDPAKVEAAITPRTRAILPVHLTGNIADMDAILAIARRHDLRVIEDAAQCIGATYRGRKAGALGDAGVFSFQQSKNIMTGEGGMIVTRDPEIARRARLIINHGEVIFDDNHRPEDLANMVGLNLRLPELCAAVGRAQLPKLEAVNAWRTKNAERLRRGLSGMPGLRLPVDQSSGNGPARAIPHLFVALHDAAAMGVPRGAFVAALRAEGVPVGTGYVRTMYEAPTFLKRVAFGGKGCPWTCGATPSHVRYARGQCPVAERLINEEFLWFYHIAYPSTSEDMDDIVSAVGKVVNARASLARVTAAEIEAMAPKSQGRLSGRGVAPAQIKGR
ncbi:MAG: DegT/DnrJ/EryC1/StrS family aminotransferase [Alphaproteobacteria bacterium]